MRKVITESQLRRVVKESVKRVLREDNENIPTDNAWIAASDEVKEILEKYGRGEISPIEAEKQIENALSWAGLYLNGSDGKVNMADANFNKNMYNKGLQHRISQNAQGINSPFGLPEENPNLY